MTDTFHRLTVASVRPLPGGAVEVVLAIPDHLASVFAFKPGQHVAVRTTIDGVDQRRTYSICSARGGPLRLGIRHVSGGIVSTWANEKLKAGDILEVAPPQGRFTLPPPPDGVRHILMIAGGAGITPILGMTIDALTTEPASRITLIYGTRSLAQTMFLEDIEDLKDKHPSRFDVIHVLSGTGQSDADMLQGRVTGEKLKVLAMRRIDLKSVERAFVCGPGSFIKETRNALFDLGMERDKVHHEFFVGRSGGAPAQAPLQTSDSAAPAAVLATPQGTIEAVAILDGQRHAFPLSEGQHVLEAALKAGIKAPYSCTGGMCSTCRARVVEGKVAMTVNYSLEDWEIQRGFVLTCQAVAKSKTLVVDYDAM